MPAHVKDDLRRLIHSLDRSEVGYIKKYWSRYSSDTDQDYIQLFDAIRDLDDPSPQALKESVGGFPWARRLSAVKNYCMQRILEALRAYHGSNTPVREINEWLDDAEILLDHGLHDEAAGRAEKALEAARTQEAFLPWLRALGWLKRFRQLIRNEYTPSVTGVDLNAEQYRVTDLYRNSLAYEELGNNMHRYLLQAGAGDPEARAWMDSVLDLELLASIESPLSKTARANYHLIRCNWFRMYKNDPNAALEEAAALNEFRETELDFFEQRAELNETAWFLYLNCALESAKFEIFLKDADAFYTWDQRPRSEREIRRASRAWQLEASYALYDQQFDRLVRLEPSIREFYRHQGSAIPPQYRVVAVFAMVRASFDTGNHQSLSFWTVQMMQLDEDVRPDLHAALTVISLMQAVDSGDNDLLRSGTRRLERYARRHLGPSATLPRLLSFFRRLPDCTPKRARQIGQETLEQLRANPPRQMFDPVGASRIALWLEARYGNATSNTGSPTSR